MKTILACALLLLPAACGTVRTDPSAATAAVCTAGQSRGVFVIRHGWHAGIAFSGAELPPGPWSAWTDEAAGRWIELGWGDAKFYSGERRGVSSAFRAAFVSGDAVVHRVFLTQPPFEAFPGADIGALRLSPEAFERLLVAIDRTFTRSADGGLIDRGEGLYGDSRFFEAEGRFSLLHNCNAWIGGLLHSAGCPISPSFITAGALMYAVHETSEGRCGCGRSDPS